MGRMSPTLSPCSLTLLMAPFAILAAVPKATTIIFASSVAKRLIPDLVLGDPFVFPHQFPVMFLLFDRIEEKGADEYGSAFPWLLSGPNLFGAIF